MWIHIYRGFIKKHSITHKKQNNILEMFDPSREAERFLVSQRDIVSGSNLRLGSGTKRSSTKDSSCHASSPTAVLKRLRHVLQKHSLGPYYVETLCTHGHTREGKLGAKVCWQRLPLSH